MDPAHTKITELRTGTLKNSLREERVRVGRVDLIRLCPISCLPCTLPSLSDGCGFGDPIDTAEMIFSAIVFM